MREKLNEKQINIDKAKAEARAKRYEEAHGKPDPERYSPMKDVGENKKVERGVKRTAPEETGNVEKSGKEAPEMPAKKSNKAIRFDSENQGRGSSYYSRSDGARARHGTSDDESEDESDKREDFS